MNLISYIFHCEWVIATRLKFMAKCFNTTNKQVNDFHTAQLLHYCYKWTSLIKVNALQEF